MLRKRLKTIKIIKMIDQLLFESFEKLKTMIEQKEFSEDIKQDMYETIHSYIQKDFEVDKDMIKYLITGWAVYYTLKRNPKKS